MFVSPPGDWINALIVLLHAAWEDLEPF